MVREKPEYFSAMRILVEALIMRKNEENNVETNKEKIGN